jgi:hypothetical protein
MNRKGGFNRFVPLLCLTFMIRPLSRRLLTSTPLQTSRQDPLGGLFAVQLGKRGENCRKMQRFRRLFLISARRSRRCTLVESRELPVENESEKKGVPSVDFGSSPSLSANFFLASRLNNNAGARLAALLLPAPPSYSPPPPCPHSPIQC